MTQIARVKGAGFTRAKKLKALRRRAKAADCCKYCKGSGRDPMSDNVNWLPCSACNGTGKK